MLPFLKKQQEPPDRILQQIDTGCIAPNPHQPRRNFDPLGLTQLAESIRVNGLLQPITVRRIGENRYQLISGERRLRASRMAGLRRIPCLVMNTDEEHVAVLALIENLQRRDLSPFEEAEAIARLISYFGLSQQDAASYLGMAGSTLANKLRLLKLPEEQRRRIDAAGLTERHARALLKVESNSLREEILDRVIAESLNVRDTELLIEALQTPAMSQEKTIPRRVAVVGDIRLFVNSLSKVITNMRERGVDAQTEKEENEEYIQYTIKIPKGRHSA